MRRRRILLLLLAAACVLCGCAPSLPDGLTPEGAEEVARAAIILFSQGDFAILETFIREDARADYGADAMAEAASVVLAGKGNLSAFRDTAVAAYTHPETGEALAAVTAVASYENGRLAYRIVMDGTGAITEIHIQ